jgi:hypothetical protein
MGSGVYLSVHRKSKRKFRLKKGSLMNKVKLLLFALLEISTSASAQTVDDIIAKSIQAKGGLAKLEAVHTIRMTANIVTANLAAGDSRARFTQVLKRRGKVRLDWSFPGFTLTQAYDGENGWQIRRSTGKRPKEDREPMTARDLKRLQEQADIDGPLVDYKQKGNTVELIGKEMVEGRDAYNLKVTLNDGDVRNFYLDADSFLYIKSSGKASVQGIEVEFENTLGDFKEVQGVLFPFSIAEHTVTAAGQQARLKTTFEEIELNVPLDDSVFRMPAVSASFKSAAKSGPTHAGDQPKKPDTGQYRTGRLLKIQDATDVLDRTHKAAFLLLILDGSDEYVAHYTVTYFGHVNKNLVAGNDIEFRISGNHVFVKTPDGKEIKARLCERIGDAVRCGDVAFSPAFPAGPGSP